MRASLFSRCVLRAVAVAAVFAMFALAANVASACPSCQAALASSENDGQGGDLISGYMWSILFMMAMPFTLLGAIGLYFYCKIRQAAKASAACREHTAPAKVEAPAPSLALQE